MTDDFGAFKAEGGMEPPDGTHTAYLDRAVVRDTKNGKSILVEWRTVDLEHWWESWYGTSSNRKAHTQKFLEAVGIDLASLPSWEALEEELALIEGRRFDVAVSHSDRGFLNTVVVGAGAANGAPPPADVEIDTEDLPAPGAPATPADKAAALFGDDVPF